MTSQPSSLPLAGRVAIVTGSSRGIGKAIAVHLAELGARVVVNYTTKSAEAELVVAEINELPAITGKGTKSDRGSGKCFRANPGEIAVRRGGEGVRVAGGEWINDQIIPVNGGYV